METLQWHELIAYSRNQRTKLKDSAKSAGILFLACLGARFLGGTHPAPDAHPPEWGNTIAGAIGISLLLAYGLPALLSLFPSSFVILSDKGINNNQMMRWGWKIRFWAWKQIASCSFGNDLVSGKNYRVLRLHDAHGHTLTTIAISRKPTEQEIVESLQTHGKTLHSESSIIGQSHF